MVKGCVLFLVVGVIVCVDASIFDFKKIPTKELMVDTKQECYLDVLETLEINCEIVNDDPKSVPHGESCTFEDKRKAGATVEVTCLNGHWSGTDFTIAETRQRRFIGFLIAAVVGATVGYFACKYLCKRQPNGEVVIYYPPKFLVHCTPEEIQNKYFVEPGENSIVIDWTAPTATDENDDIQYVKQTQGINKGGEFPGSVAGETYYIRYEAKDNQGLTDSCNFHFTVYVRTCNPPAWPANGYRQCDNHKIGSQCQYSCNDGYMLTGDSIVTCQTTLEWSNVPHCERVSCEAPDPLTNGTVSCNDETYSYGTVCTRSCDPGFDLRGQLFTQCQADGSWSKFATTSCIDNSPPTLSCKTPQVFYADRSWHSASVAWEVPIATDRTDPNPRVIKTSGPAMNDILNVGTEYVTYLAIDVDNMVSPECTIELQVKDITCGHPKDTLQDDYLDFDCTDALYTYGVECQLSCLANLPLNGTDLITCERNGTNGVWSWGNSYMPYCREISCPDLNPPINGAILYDSIQTRPTITMSCNDQYDIPSDIDGGSTFTGFLFCFDITGWGPIDYVPDCVNAINPRFLVLPGEIFYYSGDCGTEETMEEIRNNYNLILESGLNPYLSEICDSGESCSAENLIIICGPIQERRKRSTGHSTNKHAAINVDRRKRSIHTEEDLPHDLVKRQDGSHVLVVEFNIVMTMTIAENETLISKIAYYDNIMLELSAAVQALLNNGSLDINNFTTDVNSWQPPQYADIECNSGYVLDRDACKPCPAGHYLNETSTSCIQCPIGQYYGGEGSIECIECPTGYTTKQIGSKSIDNCTALCQPGSASPDGMSPCAVCLYGKYQDEYGQTSCKQCPSGTTTKNTNSTSSQDCQGYDVLIKETGAPVSIANLHSDINDVSLSFWVKRINDQALSTILQLKTGGNDALIIYLTENVRINIPDQIDETVAALNSTIWTNVVVTVSSSGNSVKVYINGNQVYAAAVSVNAPVITNGEFILTSTGTSGLYMTGLHLLDKIVDSTEITTHASSCHVIGINDVIDMSVFQNIDATGITLLTSSSCDVEDDCDPDPCNGHQCIDGYNTFTCHCSSGWSGDNCTVAPDYCTDNSCENGATCISHTTNYTCDCLPGYTGSMCEVPPVDGDWSGWTITSPCSKPCGTGSQNRTRSCDSPSPDTYGNYCVGESEDTIPCNTQACLVCDDLVLKAGTQKNCTTDGDTSDQLCTVSCENGKIMQPGYPDTVDYICGPSTLYEWNATELLPSCVEPSGPISLSMSTSIQFSSSVRESDKPALIASIIQNFETTQCSNECEVNVHISDSGATTISYSIGLTEEPNLDFSSFQSSGQISPSLQELIDSVNQLELTAQQLENYTSDIFDINVNGQSYTVDGSSPLTEGVVHCPNGQVSHAGACIYCPAGTYSNTGYCTFCEKGSYQPSEGQSSCIQCPAGLSTVTIGSTDISKCTETVTTTTSSPTTPSPTTPSQTTSSPTTPKGPSGKPDFVPILIAVVLSIVALIFACLAFGCIWYKKCRPSPKVNRSMDDLRELSPSAVRYTRKPTRNPAFLARSNTPDVLSVSAVDADVEDEAGAASRFKSCPPNDYLTPIALKGQREDMPPVLKGAREVTPPPSYNETVNLPEYTEKDENPYNSIIELDIPSKKFC
ncbi:calcium ion binding [Mactra antiquata]